MFFEVIDGHVEIQLPSNSSLGTRYVKTKVREVVNFPRLYTGMSREKDFKYLSWRVEEGCGWWDCLRALNRNDPRNQFQVILKKNELLLTTNTAISDILRLPFSLRVQHSSPCAIHEIYFDGRLLQNTPTRTHVTFERKM